MPSIIPEDLNSPGTHALVIGVSDYLHFEDGSAPTPTGREFNMEQLTAAARSASEFAAWLKNNYHCGRAPLRSLRVLLSPAANENIQPDIAALLNGDFSATLNNVKTELAGFKKACDTNTDNVGIVYIAGHGVQLTPNDAIVLLNDFGNNTHLTKLEGAINIAGVHAGMNHPATAKTQFWFVDACRQKPAIARRFESLEGALTLDKPNGATIASPLFLATGSGKAAFARVNGITLFCEALMWALNGGVAAGPEDDEINKWHIPVSQLIKRLPDRVKALAEYESVEQTVDITGQIHEAILHEYTGTPSVNLRVELLPDEAQSISTGTLKQNASDVIIDDFNDWPMQEQVEAGLYLLSIQASAPFVSRNEILRLVPPEKFTTVNVSG